MIFNLILFSGNFFHIGVLSYGVVWFLSMAQTLTLRSHKVTVLKKLVSIDSSPLLKKTIFFYSSL